MGYSIEELLSPEDATKLINEIQKYADHTIDLTQHSGEKMVEINLDFHDLLLLLANGKVKHPPKYDKKYGQYKYKIEGPTLDKEKMVAITVILDERSICVVTIY